jgi:predicted transcriptional regulator
MARAARADRRSRVAGQSNRDIARELFLSHRTVAHHLDSAMRKLCVASRTALVVRLLETGVVSNDHEPATAEQAQQPAPATHR